MKENPKIVLPNTCMSRVFSRTSLLAPGVGSAYDKTSAYFNDEVSGNPRRLAKMSKHLEASDRCLVCSGALENTVFWGEVGYRDEGRFCDGRSFTSHVVHTSHCGKCGWWTCKEELEESAFNEQCEMTRLYEGIIYRFETDLIDVPVSFLRSEIKSGTLNLSALSIADCERVVGSIFQDYFQCEAYHVGGPGDEGIDYILLAGDRNILLQIKRRSDPSETELPRVVRELIGTLVFHGENHGILATTGKGITEKQRSNLLKRQLANLRIDVFGQREIMDLLNLPQVSRPWEIAAEKILAD